jgi:hypothetical protein
MELVFPGKDAITFEVVMNEESLDHIMVAVAKKKEAKVMQKEFSLRHLLGRSCLQMSLQGWPSQRRLLGV